MPETDSKPCVYIFHGDDPVGIERSLAEMLAHMGDPGAAELNTSRLDGRTLSDEDLRTAALAVPFLAPRRLVIVRNPLARFSKGADAALQRFLSLLDEVPPSTALVLVVEDYIEGNRGWHTLKETHWLMGWIRKAGKRVLVKDFLLPSAFAMPGWIVKQAESMGGRFTPPAAQALAALVGNETQIALQEIAKLLEYVNYQRAVLPEDVALLTAVIGQANIFEMVDALAEGNAHKAQRLLQILLETIDQQSLFGMVVRQFRLLIMAREALDDGLSLEQVGKALGQKEFVTKKMVSQAQRFTLPRLECLHHRLLEIDEAAKTSAMPLETALALLVVEV